jgi:GNAT superfamily N-acetyltransferase
MEWTRGEYVISTDQERIDIAAAHRFLSDEAYWSPGVPLDVVSRAFANSIVFGLYHGTDQVGLTRVVTDRATFAWVCDVYVLPGHRGHGLGKWLIECVRAHPELQGLRRWMLATRDAHGLYAQFGFTPVEPERFMEIRDADVYKRSPRDKS